MKPVKLPPEVAPAKAPAPNSAVRAVVGQAFSLASRPAGRAQLASPILNAAPGLCIDPEHHTISIPMPSK